MHLTTAVALCGVVVLGGTAATSSVDHPDLSGQWTLNAAQSDNPRDMLQARDLSGDEPRGGRSRGGYGGRGGFGRGRGGGAASGMSDEQRQRMHQTMQLVFDAPAALTIAETDSSVAFTADGGAALVLYSDGRKVTQRVEGGGDVETRGRWHGNDFVVERTVSGGGKVTQDYLRSQDGKQLYVIVGFEGRRGRSIEFRRVYDGAASAH
jgi:hypothetical protein